MDVSVDQAGLVFVYKILSLGLSYPERGNWETLLKLTAEADSLAEGELKSMISDYRGMLADRMDRIDEVKSEYLSIFDLGRAIAPYETEHIQEKVSRKPFELADIAGFYSAFGFSLDEDKEHKEVFDHISVELEFMAIITFKEGYAIELKLVDEAMIVRDARLKFFNEHLAKWGVTYCRLILELENHEYFKKLAYILQFVLNLECEKYGLDMASFEPEIINDEPDEVRADELTC